MERTPTSRNR